MNKHKQQYLDFEAYERVAEPHKRERASAWRTAIGLQDVDGLKVSDYLKETAVRHIEGDITIDDVREQLKSYYVNKTTHDEDDAEKEEADRVAANIAKLLSEKSFSFTALEFLNVHRHLFEGVFKHAGEVRPYDISKKEWILQGDTVVYGRAADIMMALRYDIQQEKDFNYKGLSTDEIISHIVDFVTLLWQSHPFREGNTRSQFVFFSELAHHAGYYVDADAFAPVSQAQILAGVTNPLRDGLVAARFYYQDRHDAGPMAEVLSYAVRPLTEAEKQHRPIVPVEARRARSVTSAAFPAGVGSPGHAHAGGDELTALPYTPEQHEGYTR